MLATAQSEKSKGYSKTWTTWADRRLVPGSPQVTDDKTQMRIIQAVNDDSETTGTAIVTYRHLVIISLRTIRQRIPECSDI